MLCRTDEVLSICELHDICCGATLLVVVIHLIPNGERERSREINCSEGVGEIESQLIRNASNLCDPGRVATQYCFYLNPFPLLKKCSTLITDLVHLQSNAIPRPPPPPTAALLLCL